MAKEQDQSMEEILQSIKRIIAEEGEAPPPGGSDVLELTDMVGEDGSLSKAEPRELEVEAPRIETMSIDEIIAAPTAPEPAPAAPAPKPAPAPAPAPKPQPEAPVMPKPSEDSLASAQTISKSAAALHALKEIPHPESPLPPASGIGLRNGTTIEDLVLEGLKPMLREWLDANLPGMVERLVEREIKKITAQ